jgi:hypothetical protein
MISDLYIHSTCNAPLLRVGILPDDTGFVRLFAEMVRDIRRCNFATLELLVFNPLKAPAPTTMRRFFPSPRLECAARPADGHSFRYCGFSGVDRSCFGASHPSKGSAEGGKSAPC